jgi:hypothetical protein
MSVGARRRRSKKRTGNEKYRDAAQMLFVFRPAQAELNVNGH